MPHSLVATGGTPPYTFTLIGGSLPPGLSLSASGVISGTPTTAGIFNFTVQVTDSGAPPQTASANCQIVISAGPLGLACGIQGPAMIGIAYSQQLAVTGGVPPFHFDITSGGLPPGLVLDTATGIISGTPTTAGTYPFRILVTDAVGHTAFVDCSITLVCIPGFLLTRVIVTMRPHPHLPVRGSSQ